MNAESSTLEITTPRISRFQDLSRKLLDEAVEAFEPKDAPLFRDLNLRAAREAVSQLELIDVIDFHQGLASGEISLSDFAERILLREEQLHATIAMRVPETIKERQRSGLLLACYVACVFIPAAAFRKRFGVALEISRHLLDRFMSPAHHKVIGMGNLGGDVRTRHLMISPVMASLCLNCPESLLFSVRSNS